MRVQYSCPQSGQTLQGFNIHVHKVDGPYEGSIFMSTKWMDPTRVQYSCPRSGQTLQGLTVRLVHKVDGPYKGSVFNMSTK